MDERKINPMQKIQTLMKILMMIMVMKTKKKFSGIVAQRNVVKPKPAHW